MKHITFNLLFFANSILLILYMGLAANGDTAFSATEIVPLFLSSLMLIDITYISSCNVRENKVISLFCGLLAFHSWYVLLAASHNTVVTSMAFTALSPVIWYVSIHFILMFLFQDSGYKFKKAASICLAGTCICSLIGISVSNKLFALFYGIQFLTGWLCFLFIVAFHRKRAAFILKAEWKCILSSLVVVIVLFLAYYFSTMGVSGRLSNFGLYLPILLFSMSIHSMIRKEHSSLPLSTVFSKRQFAFILLSGAITCCLAALAFGSLPLFFLMLDAMSVFVYACNIALDYNLKHEKNDMLRKSKYHAALAQLQQEEQLNLEFANFLHDDILQDLLSIKNMMKKAGQPDIQNIITETLERMNTYIRERMQDYRPAMLPKLTVKENYQNLLEYISQSFPHRKVHITFECQDSLFLAAPYDVFVYRILKELATNVYKHSDGDKAWITLIQDNGGINLCIRDNGTADAAILSTADLSKHRGLALITDRINRMDGFVKTTNNFPHGVCIQLSLPMKGDVSYQYFISR